MQVISELNWFIATIPITKQNKAKQKCTKQTVIEKSTEFINLLKYVQVEIDIIPPPYAQTPSLYIR